jgi:hypothetical protein
MGIGYHGSECDGNTDGDPYIDQHTCTDHAGCQPDGTGIGYHGGECDGNTDGDPYIDQHTCTDHAGCQPDGMGIGYHGGECDGNTDGDPYVDSYGNGYRYSDRHDYIDTERNPNPHPYGGGMC